MWKELERIKHLTMTLLSVISNIMPTTIITAQAIKYWQIAYYQPCLLLMTNEEAKQYAIQTSDNAQFILI